MSLKSTITKAVESAFEAMDDLVQVGTLTNNKSSGFNFQNGTATAPTFF